MASPKSASRSALLPFRLIDVAPGADGIVITADAHIDRRQHLPGLAVIGIAGDVVLDPGDHVLDVARLGRGLHARRQRFARQVRRTEREIERKGAGRQQDEAGDGGDAAVPERSGFLRGPFGFRGIGGGNQPARHLDAGGFGFGVADQAGGAVALDFVQLVAVDGDIAAAAQGRAPRQRPEHREHRGRRHQYQHEPECHRTILPVKPLELLPEKTLQGQKSVGMTTYVATAVFSTPNCPNPLIHIKAAQV